jgi:hypothetical protein
MSNKIRKISYRIDVAASGQNNTNNWRCHEINLSAPDGMDYWEWIEQAVLLAILEHDALTARVAELECALNHVLLMQTRGFVVLGNEFTEMANKTLEAKS